MKFTKMDDNMNKWTKQDLDAMLAARKRQAARDKLNAQINQAKTKATDLGLGAVATTQSFASKALSWARENPQELLIGIMAVAILDVEDALDDLD